uniref:ADP-ribosylation factor-like protein 16 isoform X6 n=1 Tax=Petromyzon marinus TaxID=7757 RepID=A0AAJ7UJ60_PETMA|nr:ADP-ribosylation factor-like protein 16 isoform X6 [Petromyzon marinus]
MLLLLGPTGSGKTLLLKRLQKIFAGERVDKWEAPSTVPTFVVDVANPRQLASAGVQLWEVLAHEEVRGKSLCVLLNKTDLATSGAVREFRSLLRLDDPEATAAVTTSPPENHADDDDDDDDVVAEGKREAGKVTAGVAAATRVNVLGGSARDGAGVTELAEWIRRLAARR